MRKELDEKLSKAFPLLYADRYGPKQETCMYWGFPGDGWFDLLWGLSERMEELLQEIQEKGYLCACGHNRKMHGRFRLKFWKKPKCKHIRGWRDNVQSCRCTGFRPVIPRAAQVKEKLGTLSFYMTSYSPNIHSVIDWYTSISGRTCEMCGSLKGRKCNTGLSGGWLKVYCEDCEEKDKERVVQVTEEWKAKREAQKKCPPGRT